MAPLSTFPQPLPLNRPPSGYGCSDRPLSDSSSTTAFVTGLDERDTFFGVPRCVVCGISSDRVVQHCHICMQPELHVWTDLKRRNYVPSQAKHHPAHEPRNGLLMCSNHHILFDTYAFFIRFVPAIEKFVFVNFAGHPELQKFHGKSIALDIKDRHAPFPSLFIIHEMRVRGFHPFQPTEPAMPDGVAWQDWILADGVYDHTSQSFNRGPPSASPSPSLQPQLQFQSMTTGTAGGTSSGHAKVGERTVVLNADVISEILAATHAMPSWKACQMEGTSWAGTAEENMQKYVDTVGVEDCDLFDS